MGDMEMKNENEDACKLLTEENVTKALKLTNKGYRQKTHTKQPPCNMKKTNCAPAGNNCLNLIIRYTSF